MINTTEILETIQMITEEHLDIRTITMGISLLDCCDPDIDRACEKIYRKITQKAKNLVKTGEDIEKEYGIPIINKRISVTPIAMVLAACENKDAVRFAKTLDRAAQTVGVNFIGGYSALVQKGFAAGDKELIASIPEALAQTERVCSSVNIGSTKTGINMDAVRIMGETVKRSAELTADRNCIGSAKLVVFCNAPEDNPFMAGAFHGPGEPDCILNVGVSGPGVVRAAIAKANTMMHDMEIEILSDIVRSGALDTDRMLVVDGPLQFLRQDTGKAEFADLFYNVIGVSKNFNPMLPTSSKSKRGGTQIGAELLKLEYGERTPVFLKENDRGRRFGVWYLRIRPKNKVSNPLEGIIKIENMVLADYYDSGIPTDVVDTISLSLLNECSPTCYGRDERWASHLYPIYLTETLIKSTFESDLVFINNFKRDFR